MIEVKGTRKYLIGIFSRPPERSLERKALVLIERIASEEGELGETDEAMTEVYRLSHSVLGKCGNPHDSWVSEIRKKYASLRRNELKRKKKLLAETE